MDIIVHLIDSIGKDSGVDDASKKGPGSISRARTQQYLGLGQASAEATKVGPEEECKTWCFKCFPRNRYEASKTIFRY